MSQAAVEHPAARPGPWLSIADRLYGWRNRLVASRRFRSFAARFAPTRPIARRQASALFDLCAGFVYSQVLTAIVELRLLEMLADRPLDGQEIACRAGLPPENARRLLDAAASLGLLDRRGWDRFGVGLSGAVLLGDPGIRAMVAHHRVLYRDLVDPVSLLRGERVGGLADYWPYASSNRAELTKAAVEPYSRLMAASQPMVAEQVLDAYPLGHHRALLDIGGGEGAFASAAARRHPKLACTVFDLPAVAELARARFAREGLSGRADSVGGSFLSDPLPPGRDAAALIRILHDHDEAPALAILRAAHAALAPGGTLIVAEPMAGAGGEARVSDAYFGFYLLAMGSGRARSAEHLTRLMEQAGFSQIRRHRTALPLAAGLLTGKKPRQPSNRVDSSACESSLTVNENAEGAWTPSP